jgi:predicted Holliday junction resolvase-like endonuclease
MATSPANHIPFSLVRAKNNRVGNVKLYLCCFKVSVSTFDQSFTLLDQALNDALEKMSNQMSVEEALRQTLNEMQSGMEMKLNREDMENLKEELEARIKEVRAAQEKGLVAKNEIPKDPAGFKR